MKCHNCNKWVEIECTDPNGCGNNIEPFGVKINNLLQEMVDTLFGKEIEIKADNKSDNNN